MKENEKEQSVSSAFMWNLSERIGVQGIQFVISIVLARILSPNDYGIISLISAFISIASVFVESGISAAVIHKKVISDCEMNSLFTVGFMISALLCLSLLMFAPNIAAYFENYNTKLLINLIRSYAMVLPISSITSIQTAVVYRNMQFRKNFVVNLFGIVISGTVGVAFAMLGFGVWALAAQQIITRVVSLVVLTIMLRWIPRPVKLDKSIIPELIYGAQILANSLVSTLYNQIRSLLIGKYYSSENLAFYNKGEMFPAIIATNTDYALQKVMFSAYSKKQDSIIDVKNMMRKTINISTFVLVPMMLGLMAISSELILLVLTDKWLVSVPFMQVFCIIYLLQPIKSTVSQALNAVGRSNTTLYIGLFSKGIGVLLIILVLQKGTLYIAYAALFAEVVTSFFYIFAASKHFSYSFKEQFEDVAMNILTGTLMFIAVTMVSYLNLLSPWSNIAIKAVIGVIVYCVTNKIIGTKGFLFSYQLIKRKIM